MFSASETANTEFVTFLVNGHGLSERGLHGKDHWLRVLLNGRVLTERTGANLKVVELFALLHDSCRENEGHDPGHGARAADYAQTLRGEWFTLDDGDMELLSYACRYHSDGLTDGDVTVRTCWDADRLDLGRVGIRPEPRYLCTQEAADPRTLEAAYARSLIGRR